MRRVIVIPNPTKDEELKVTGLVICKLKELGFTPFIDRKYNVGSLFDVEIYDEPPVDSEFMVIIGGDGSVIITW